MSKPRVLAMVLALIVLFNLSAGAASAAKAKSANPKFASASITLQKGGKADLKTKLKSTPKVTFQFASSNSKIASVTSTGVVTGIAAGKASITATVSQKGYTGKASIAIQVVDPPAKSASNPSKPSSAKPVVYQDLTQLNTDIRTGLQALYKKDYSKLTDAEKAQRDKLLNIDRQQFLTGLQTFVANAQPVWAGSLAQDFAAHNLEDNIPDIAALFTKAGSDDTQRLAALELLKAFKSEKALNTFGSLLLSSQDAGLRYSLAYLLSQFSGNPAAIAFLQEAMAQESDDSAFLNEAASLVVSVGTDKDLIHQTLLLYGKLPDSRKDDFALTLSYNDPTFTDVYKAWKAELTEGMNSSDAAFKQAADSLWGYWKYYPQFKD